MTTLHLQGSQFGAIGVRDPESPCDQFDPRPRQPLDAPPACWSDGHYLCRGCKWFDEEGRRRNTDGR
jgi:hypothetical protein